MTLESTGPALEYPATCAVHWASGPVPCCDQHARELVGIGRFLGAHVPVTELTAPATCTNCANEAATRSGSSEL